MLHAVTIQCVFDVSSPLALAQCVQSRPKAEALLLTWWAHRQPCCQVCLLVNHELSKRHNCYGCALSATQTQLWVIPILLSNAQEGFYVFTPHPSGFSYWFTVSHRHPELSHRSRMKRERDGRKNLAVRQNRAINFTM